MQFSTAVWPPSRLAATAEELDEAAKDALAQDEIPRWCWKAFEPKREIDARLELNGGTGVVSCHVDKWGLTW
jgi:hypothetical protein